MTPPPVYSRTLDAVGRTSRFVSSCGGTRSGKTFAILEVLYKMACRDRRPTVTSVISETFPHLKRGAIRDFRNMLDSRWDESCWSRTDSIYTLSNGSMIEFFSADNPGKVHGPARDRLFINEAQSIPWDVARQLLVRTRGLVLLDYNPTHEFWVQKEIEPRDTCVTIVSTYQDNPYLSPEQVAEIEANRHDKNWWRVYGEGKVGQLEGLIFPDFVQVDSLPELSDGMVETWGLDYGFACDPSALVHCYTDNRKKELWLDERLYRTGMLNEDLAAAMKAEGIGRTVRVYADSAEPKTNETLRRYGYNIQPSYKATKIAEQIQAIRGYKMHVTKRSLNLIRELRGYVWMTNKAGEWLNEPVDMLNHAIDSFRYGVFPIIKVHRETHSTLSRT